MVDRTPLREVENYPPSCASLAPWALVAVIRGGSGGDARKRGGCRADAGPGALWDGVGVGANVVSPVFIGRREELASLASLLDRVDDGEPAFALIGGEAGIGKTRLSRELGRSPRSLLLGQRHLGGPVRGLPVNGQQRDHVELAGLGAGVHLVDVGRARGQADLRRLAEGQSRGA
ncbi:ATP-binding protein [Trebonia kvetii]|uniref:ATP-binding protein n=1 Tax=Trebonia kvetii TaxID=2480626 RepID=A0A6P2C203_9ACTN|nr:ATP-binding protein [Trebonia kvetii]